MRPDRCGRPERQTEDARAVRLARLGRPQTPVVVVGYSRGGRLAAEAAAVMWRIGVRPAAVIRSRGTFHADHFSALQWGPEARRQLWTPLDRLIASVR